jgi:hypothetical protein
VRFEIGGLTSHHFYQLLAEGFNWLLRMSALLIAVDM